MANRTMKISAVLTLLGLSAFANADPIAAGTYVVEDAATNCTNSPHGLWTNSLLTGTCANYFSATSIIVEVAADGKSGTIIGSATNPGTTVATINLSFSGWSDALPGGKVYKKEGGGDYDPVNQDFFSSLTGTITIDGMVYYIAIHGPTTLQLGIGANAKQQTVFGLSTWMDPTKRGATSPLSHWDLNFGLVQVPEPATLALLGLGLFGAGLARRKVR